MNPEVEPHVLVRVAWVDDAERLLDFVALMAPTLNFHPSEFWVKNIDQEREEIATFSKSTNSLFLLAEDAGLIVGTITLAGRGVRTGAHRQADAHVAELGISVHPDYRGLGIGTVMWEKALKIIREAPMPIRRIEATNYSTNHDGRAWLLKQGFDIEGVRRKAILKDGEYIDVLMMSRLLGDLY